MTKNLAYLAIFKVMKIYLCFIILAHIFKLLVHSVLIFVYGIKEESSEDSLKTKVQATFWLPLESLSGSASSPPLAPLPCPQGYPIRTYKVNTSGPQTLAVARTQMGPAPISAPQPFPDCPGHQSESGQGLQQGWEYGEHHSYLSDESPLSP